MKKDSKNNKSVEKTTPKSISGKSTDALTKRHLKDKNDKITDDDIRNIQIDTSVDSDEPLPLKNNRPHDVDKDNPKSTPWDIISE
jgi:hypothetical protein